MILHVYYFVDVDHISETDVEGVNKLTKKGSKFVPPSTMSSTEESEMELLSQRPDTDEGGIKFNSGKTLRWHRPKRKEGTQEKVGFYKSLLIT